MEQDTKALDLALASGDPNAPQELVVLAVPTSYGLRRIDTGVKAGSEHHRKPVGCRVRLQPWAVVIRDRPLHPRSSEPTAPCSTPPCPHILPLLSPAIGWGLCYVVLIALRDAMSGARSGIGGITGCSCPRGDPAPIRRTAKVNRHRQVAGWLEVC